MKIVGYIRVDGHEVALNGKRYEVLLEPNQDFLTAIYKGLSIDYRKFYKMDSLSKMGFLMAELLMGADSDKIKTNFGILLANSVSCLDADKKYYSTIKEDSNYYPSPSDFVYTLPNIVCGEIAIRNKIQGETSFMIQKEFDAQRMEEDVSVIMRGKGMETMLCGWVDCLEGNYDGLLIRVERTSKEGIEFNTENINKLYNLNIE